MKEIEFKDLKNYNDSNSVVLCGIIPDCEPADVEEFFHKTGFTTESKKVTELRHLSDNVKGDEGRSDILVIMSEEGSCNPFVRIQLSQGGPSIKWTSDFIDNYKQDYISGNEI